MAVFKIKKVINPKDVYVRIRCSVTKKTFRVGLDGAITKVTCRCARESWRINGTLSPGELHITLTHVGPWGTETPVELPSEDVELDQS